MLHAGELVSKADLTEHIYQQDFDRDSNVLEVFIGRLRKKLDPEGELKPIETVRGRGYRFAIPRSEVESPSPVTAQAHGGMARARAAPLQSRQLLAASLGLVAFLALDRLRARPGLLDRPRRATCASAWRATPAPTSRGIEFTRDGELIDPPTIAARPALRAAGQRPVCRGRAAATATGIRPRRWAARCPSRRCSTPREQRFEGPLPIIDDNGVSRRGLPLQLRAWSGQQGERAQRRVPASPSPSPRTPSALAAQIRVFRRALWGYLGGAGAGAAAVQMLVLRWSLRPLRQVDRELTRVQRGVSDRAVRAASARTRAAHRQHQRADRERAREPRPQPQHAGRPRAQPEDAAGGAARAPGRPAPRERAARGGRRRRCGA